MPLQIWKVLRDALMRTGNLGVDLATGGSTTTIVSGNLDPENQEDDAYKGGLAIILRDSAGANAAPEGEFSRISGFVADTGTFTVSTLSAAVASGDQFGYTSPQFPLQDMLVLLNNALEDLGDMPLVDTTTLDTIAGDSEYAAAVAWKRARPYRIDIQGRTGDSADNQWEETTDWEWVPAAAGSAGRIIFGHYPLGSRDIRVWYRDVHGTVNAYSDVINERIDPELIVRAMVYQIRNWQVERDDGSDDGLKQKWNKAKADLDEIKLLRPIPKPKRKPKLLIVGRDEHWLKDDRVRPPPPP
jgi:hypothetical protein